MKIKTTYIPADTDGNPISLLHGVYTLADLVKLGQDLAAAGVQPDTALKFTVTTQGDLVVTSESVV